MQILEFKSQNLIIDEREEQEFLIPIIPVDSTLSSEQVRFNFEIRENASVRVFVIGVLSGGEIKILLNSLSIGANSSFDTKVGFVQFGNSLVDFTGLMRIENGAKNANTNLQAKSLLLSKSASANLVPSLEILENEVSASHGTIVKSIDPDEVFYLRSRGISLEKANKLLISGFLNGFGVELPKEISDKFNLIIEHELSEKHCALDCKWCGK